MPQFYYDILYCLSFVVALTAIATVGRPAFKKCQDAFRQIIFGLSFLTLFSIIHMVGHNQIFLGANLLNDPYVLQVVEATLIVGGLIFLMVGLGGWLPSKNISRREKQSLHKRYYSLKMMHQTIGSAKTFDTILEQVNIALTSYLGLSRSAGFKYSNKTDSLHLAHASGFETPHPDGFRKIALTDTDLKNRLFSMRVSRDAGHNTILDNGRQPDILIPIGQGGRLYGTILCWTGDAPVDDDLLDFMTVAGESISRKTHDLVDAESGRRSRQHHQAYERLTLLCNQTNSIQQLTKPLFELMHELTGAEYLTLADLDNSGENMFRYTIGSGGRVLLEKRVSRSTMGTDIETIFKEGRPVLRSSMPASSQFSGEDGVFLSCGMNSKIACPIMIGRKVLAVMILGHSAPGYFTPTHLRQVQELAFVVAVVFDKERLHDIIETKEDQMIRLQLMERNLMSEKSLDALFNDACDILTRRMKCTMARISLIDRDAKSLVSQSWKTIRDTGMEVNKSETIPLSLLPWHRMAVETDKPMLINQSDLDSQMQAQESSQTLLADIKSAMLVPIKLGNRVSGVISIGEVRNWNRRTFNAADLVLAKDIAAKCSVALRLNHLEREKATLDSLRRKNLFAESDSEYDWRTDVKSPLTSIMGAVELLKTKVSEEDKFSSRYHDLILRSADRIKNMAEQQEPVSFISTFADPVEMEPEQVIG